MLADEQKVNEILFLFLSMISLNQASVATQFPLTKEQFKDDLPKQFQ